MLALFSHLGANNGQSQPPTLVDSTVTLTKATETSTSSSSTPQASIASGNAIDNDASNDKNTIVKNGMEADKKENEITTGVASKLLPRFAAGITNDQSNMEIIAIGTATKERGAKPPTWLTPYYHQ